MPCPYANAHLRTSHGQVHDELVINHFMIKEESSLEDGTWTEEVARACESAIEMYLATIKERMEERLQINRSNYAARFAFLRQSAGRALLL